MKKIIYNHFRYGKWKKTLSVMKLIIAILMCSIGTILASPALSQETKLNVSYNNETLEKVLNDLRKRSGYDILYYKGDIPEQLPISLDKKSATLEEILLEILPQNGLTYTITGEIITITRAQNSPQQQQKMRPLKGTIADANGDPIVGATIFVDGTVFGTTSDKKGQFTLQIPDRSENTIIISFIGMKSQRIVVKKQNELKIIMKEDEVSIDEIVVTGYLGIDRGSYVGAITQIKAEDIQVMGESTIDQMLQGWVPGMSVINTSGKIGATPKVRIRGTSTILGNQEPLWVVDGVIQLDPLPIPDDSSPIYSEMEGLRETAGNAISWLNPADIETITVLKDASATAIYGSQAANGVIVITTKKTKDRGLSISYNGSFSVGQKPGYHLYDMMNSQESMRFQQEMWEDRNSYNQQVLPIGYGGLIQQLQKKEITHEQFQQMFRKMENENTDWFKLLFRNSFSHQHNMSISGMGEKISTRFSIGINQQFGEAKGNDMESFTASSNSTFRFGDNSSIDLMLNGTYRTTENFAFGVSPYEYAMNTTRTIPVRNDDGTLFYHEKAGNTSYSIPDKWAYGYNILNEIDNTGTKTTGSNIQAAINLRLKLIEHLEFQSSLSYQIASSKIKSYATEQSHYISSIRGYNPGEVVSNSSEQHASILPFGGLLQLEEASSNNFSFRNSLVFYKNFRNDHSLTVNLGLQVTSNKQEGSTNMRYGYLYYRGENFATVPKSVTAVSGMNPNTRDLHEEMRKGTKMTTTTANAISEYLTAVYNFQGRYVVNFNARLDASNRFGQDENKKFNPSWSLGFKWRVGNERFMDWASSWYDMFDVSFSYGWRGNAVQAVSPYLIARDGGLDTYFQQYTLNMVSLPYPGLGWEKTKDWNLGISFSFLKGRLSADINLYDKISHVLSSREVPVENGVQNAYFEGTKMGNKGYEISISATPIRTEDFTWSLSFNTSRVRNRIKENDRINSLDDYLSGNATVSGESYQTFYAYAFDGLSSLNGQPTFKNMDIGYTENYLDFLTKVGRLEANITGGLNMSFRYKNFYLRTHFALSFGGQTFLPEYFATAGAPTPEKNSPRYLFDRWRKPGDEKNTDIPSIPAGNPNTMQITLPSGPPSVRSYSMYNKSDVRVADTDFIRCRTISLQYDLPKEWSNAINFKRISISANVANPFFIAFDSKWEGRDPETANWPARRTASFSLNLNF